MDEKCEICGVSGNYECNCCKSGDYCGPMRRIKGDLFQCQGCNQVDYFTKRERAKLKREAKENGGD